jgi:hypothetical protein
MGHMAAVKAYAAQPAPQSVRAEFFRLLGESVQALLEVEQPTGAVHVKILIRDGEPWAASVGVEP